MSETQRQPEPIVLTPKRTVVIEVRAASVLEPEDFVILSKEAGRPLTDPWMFNKILELILKGDQADSLEVRIRPERKR